MGVARNRIGNCLGSSALARQGPMRRFKWLTGDLDWLTYGGMWYRRTGCGTYHIIKFVNLEDAGEPIDGMRYVVELGEVNLAAAHIEQAARRHGMDDSELLRSLSELALVQLVAEDWQVAPLGEWLGNNARALLKRARGRSLELDDPDEYSRAMNRTVNKLGSTAREYQVGDLASPVLRGLEQGNEYAWLLAMMCGCSEEELENAGYSSPFRGCKD